MNVEGHLHILIFKLFLKVLPLGLLDLALIINYSNWVLIMILSASCQSALAYDALKSR